MNNSNNSDSTSQDELDLVQLYKNILANKLYIISITFVFFLGSIAYSLSLPNLYTSSSLLNAVQKGGQSSSGTKGGLGSILSLAGGASGAGDRANLAIAIINSREFFEHLTTIDGVLPKLIAAESYNSQTGELIYDQNLYDEDLKKWKLSLTEAYAIAYQKVLVANLNNKTGFITLSYDHISPDFAYEFVTLIIDQVNFLARKKDIQEAADAMNYLQNDITEYSQIGIQSSIAQLIESQLKTQMLANVRKNYLLDPIDRPMRPDMKSKPYRAKLVVMGTVIGFIISLLFTLIISYGFNGRFKK
ncbi:Wzz/FepE/Etk N-terminal domain-containing protein [Gammaproteobacteria bacterium]|nr:Wzz/FepE/Etk N-terminal domain-containing protein [Gammaproteobacteria bacterium]